MSTNKRYIIHDTLEAFLEDLDTGKTYFFGLTTSANINKSVAQEPIRAGLHNKIVGMIQSDEGLTFGVTVGVHYDDIYEIQMGNTFAEGTATIQKVTESADGTFTATEEEVTGDILDLDADKLPKNYKVQLHGIAYDPETNVVVADIYWIFDKALPDGNLEETFEAGTNKTSEVNFTAQVPRGSSSYGKYVVVPR